MTHWSDRYGNISFVPLGRGFTGVDCWGLFKLVLLNEKGIELPDYTGFYEKADDKEAGIIAAKIASEVVGEWVRVAPGDEQEFDGMLITLNGIPCHIGVVAQKNYVLHIVAGANSCIEDYRTLAWKAPGKIAGFYRHRKLCK